MMLKNASLTQSLCVRGSVRLQKSLARRLEALIRKNKLATQLRFEKMRAEAELKLALTMLSPGSALVARAKLLAVQLRQAALAAEQKSLLREAELERRTLEAGIRAELSRSNARGIRSTWGAPTALAVRPSPPTDLTPDYLPVPRFRENQAQSVRYRYPLFPPAFPGADEFQGWTAEGRCSVSLTPKGVGWIPAIVAASASWN